MTCPLPTPQERRRHVRWLIRHTSRAQRPLLRAKLYADVPAMGVAEELGLEPKSRCVICWKKRPLRMKWKEYGESHRYTCEHRTCCRVWLRLTRAEEQVQTQAKEHLVEAVAQGVSP